uniref:Uncharacterized protein n=1 Tax=Leptobrachium leishanense TaxID=445787 RepID=A0A8C5PGY8_9ANUR
HGSAKFAAGDEVNCNACVSPIMLLDGAEKQIRDAQQHGHSPDEETDHPTLPFKILELHARTEIYDVQSRGYLAKPCPKLPPEGGIYCPEWKGKKEQQISYCQVQNVDCHQQL